MPFLKVQPEKLSSSVVRQIEQLILRGILRPGERLPPERDLAERLGVSRPSLRDAIAELSDHGLLTSRAGSGVFVAEVLGSAFSPALIQLFASHDEAVFDYIAFRRDMEALTAERAALEALRLVWPEASEDEFLSALDYGAAGLEGEPGGHDWPEAFWTIDPIDGTKGFIRGHQYSVCLALVVRGVPTVGVLGCPNLSADLERPFDDPDPHGITVVAGGGDAGVWAVPTDEPGTRLRRLEVAPRSGASGEEGAIRFCESWESSHTDQSATRRVMRVLADAGHAIGPAARIDSQCKYVVAARGQADVFLRRPRDSHRRDWIWDHAPGWLIATRAGLCVTDAHGREVRFGLGRTLAANHGVLAARGTTHALVRRALAQLDGPGER